jgi:hypothetical protein
MSPRTVCKLEKFQECSKALPKSRPWQEFCCGKHRKRFGYLLERLVRRRRLARKRNRAASNAPRAHSGRVYCRRYIEVGSVRKALMVLSESRPEFFLRLAASSGWTVSSGMAHDLAAVLT